MTDTLRIEADRAGVEKAADILRGGGLVAFPTETVYGLGADATNDRAVAGIFEAKGRPSFNPLIVHVASFAHAMKLCEFDGDAMRLADSFWPGPLTLVLPLKTQAGVSKLVTAGGDLLAVRVPEGEVAQSLMDSADCPIAAPSANPSGRISPTNADHVMAGLNGKIDAVLDAGPCPVGVESTILGFDGGAHLLRAGGLPVEAIEACLGRALATRAPESQPTAPGQLASHYAPQSDVRLEVADARAGEVLIGFGDTDGDFNLSPSGDLVEAAARLFDLLHRADATGCPIAVARIPNTGLGRAVNDRLRRAAAPRV